YTLRVKTSIQADVPGDTRVYLLNQNRNGTNGETSDFPGGDQFVTSFTVNDTFRVTSATPAAPLASPPGLTGIDLNFSLGVVPSTFDTADLKLVDPSGTVVTGLLL